MANEKKYYSYALISIVAIVAIVGIVVMMLNAQPNLSTDLSASASAEQEPLLGAATTTVCTDSDGGKNYILKGTTTKETNIVTDYCLATGIKLVEYYCSAGRINSITYDCSKVGKVCQNGACINPVCVTGETKPCTVNNGCSGTQTCVSGVWSSCTSSQNRCDQNCDGTADTCVSGSCFACQCIGSASRDCTLPDGTNGVQTCNSGTWGTCQPYYVSETDYCTFGSTGNWTNYCYSNKGNCSGYDSCSANVMGTQGERLTWLSNCQGYANTTIDGTNEYMFFNCSAYH